MLKTLENTISYRITTEILSFQFLKAIRIGSPFLRSFMKLTQIAENTQLKKLSFIQIKYC